MPALKEEYEYYEYVRRYQGTAKNAVPSSAAYKNNRTSSKKTSNGTVSTQKTTRPVQTINLKTSTTRDVTKKATRLATQDDFLENKKKAVSSQKTTGTRKNNSKKNNLSDDFLFTNKKTAKTYEKPQEMTLKRPKSNVKSKTIAKQKAKVKEMFRNCTIASLIFSMFFFICYRYSIINEGCKEVNDLKAKVAQQQYINSQLEKQIHEETITEDIENYAKNQLGMQKPKESQIQKINVKKKDKIITPIEIKEEKEVSKIATIFNDFLKILD